MVETLRNKQNWIVPLPSLIIALLFIVHSCSVPSSGHHQQKKLSFDELDPKILEINGKEVFQFWEFDDHTKWWKFDVGKIESIILYQDSIKALLQSDFQSTLDKERFQNAQVAKIAKDEDRDKMNLDLVQKSLLGTIREMSYLEAQLLNYQLSQYPLLSHPTEFHAFIAKHEGNNLIRVYFAASDQGFPPQPRIIISELEKEVKNGWILHAHLHNHYGDKKSGYFGKMAPSLADAQYYKMLRDKFDIEEALITNGFSTVVIPAANFDRFESH